MLPPPRVTSDQSADNGDYLAGVLHRSDLWLTPKSIEGFDFSDFAEWQRKERDELGKEVAAFLAIAERVAPDQPATKTQSTQARKHLERIIEIVGNRVLHEWVEAQEKMIHQAKQAAQAKGWYVEQDEKEMLESLLGRYKAPRLRIRTPNREIILDPVARFGSGHQGIVDLVVMPAYKTAYLVAFKNGEWQIVAPRGTTHKRPFTQATLVNTITSLSHS